MNINSLRVGDQARIIALGRNHSLYRKRLLAMGLTPGTTFTITRIAPLGDPIEINVRGFALSLRKDEASILTIEQVFFSQNL